jgi:drug/metabolite transporter (DMT)-like permease
MASLATYLSVAVAAILWGSNFNLVKPVVAEMEPLIAAADRYLIAAGIMLVITYATGNRLTWRHARIYLILGVLGVFGFNLFFFLGMSSTSPVNGALIMGLNPVLTSLIGSWILGDQPTRLQWLAFPVGLLGVAIVVLGAGARLEVSRGDALLFVASVSWALYNVYLRKLAPKGASALATTTGTMVAGAAALTLVALLSGERFVVPTLYAGSALLTMSVSGGVLAYLLWSAGIAKLGPARAAIFMNVVPVSSMAISTVSGVPPTAVQLLGGALVIGAVLYSALTGAPAKVTTSPCVTSPCG